MTGLVLLSALLAVAPAQAELRQHELELFALEPGLRILFDTTQLVPTSSRYWTEIELTATSEDALSFRYEMYAEGTSYASSGSSVVRDRQACRALDPWWGPGLSERAERCELWLSTLAFDELRSSGVTHLAIDVHYRGDSALELRLLRYERFALTIDARMVELRVMVLESSLGDQLWVYDRRENPFVLRATVVGVYDWFVTELSSP